MKLTRKQLRKVKKPKREVLLRKLKRAQNANAALRIFESSGVHFPGYNTNSNFEKLGLIQEQLERTLWKFPSFIRKKTMIDFQNQIDAVFSSIVTRLSSQHSARIYKGVIKHPVLGFRSHVDIETGIWQNADTPLGKRLQIPRPLRTKKQQKYIDMIDKVSKRLEYWKSIEMQSVNPKMEEMEYIEGRLKRYETILTRNLKVPVSAAVSTVAVTGLTVLAGIYLSTAFFAFTAIIGLFAASLTLVAILAKKEESNVKKNLRSRLNEMLDEIKENLWERHRTPWKELEL